MNGGQFENCPRSAVFHKKTGYYAPVVYDPISEVFPGSARKMTSAYPYSSDRSRHKPQQSSKVANAVFSNGAAGQRTS